MHCTRRLAAHCTCLGADQMIRGGGVCGSPVQHFFFAPNQKQIVLSSQAREQQPHPPIHNPVFLPLLSFVNKLFIVYSLLNRTIFSHVLLNNLFFKEPPPTPYSPPPMYHLVGPLAAKGKTDQMRGEAENVTRVLKY